MAGNCTTAIFSSSSSLTAVLAWSSISSQTNSGITQQICKFEKRASVIPWEFTDSV